MNGNLSMLDAVAAQMPEELKGFYNSRRVKTEDELIEERRRRENERRKQPEEIKLEARENNPKWVSEEKKGFGPKPTPDEEFIGEVHGYEGAPVSRGHNPNFTPILAD